MNIKKICKQTEKNGVIVCLNNEEKETLKNTGFVVKEILTPCGSSGHQSVQRPQ